MPQTQARGGGGRRHLMVNGKEPPSVRPRPPSVGSSPASDRRPSEQTAYEHPCGNEPGARGGGEP